MQSENSLNALFWWKERKIRFEDWTRWWGYGEKKNVPKSCWRRITGNAVEVICDQLVWSLLVNALRKALQREADMSVTGKGGEMDHSESLCCSLCKPRVEPRIIRHNWMYLLQYEVLFYCDMAWSFSLIISHGMWLFSLDPDTRHESEWWKIVIHHMDFSLNQAKCCINFSSKLFGNPFWSLDTSKG